MGPFRPPILLLLEHDELDSYKTIKWKYSITKMKHDEILIYCFDFSSNSFQVVDIWKGQSDFKGKQCKMFQSDFDVIIQGYPL